jgi:hypothetical protein
MNQVLADNRQSINKLLHLTIVFADKNTHLQLNVIINSQEYHVNLSSNTAF